MPDTSYMLKFCKWKIVQIHFLFTIFVVLVFETVPPHIVGTSEPQNLSVLQNRQMILECKSDAVPPPTTTWLKNGELLQVCHLNFSPEILLCYHIHRIKSIESPV